MPQRGIETSEFPQEMSRRGHAEPCIIKSWTMGRAEAGVVRATAASESRAAPLPDAFPGLERT
jgi:hypothetical protein